MTTEVQEIVFTDEEKVLSSLNLSILEILKGMRELATEVETLRSMKDPTGKDLGVEIEKMRRTLFGLKIKLLQKYDIEPIEEAQARAILSSIALDIRRTYFELLDSYLIHLKSNPIVALGDQKRIRELSRYRLYYDILDKAGLLNLRKESSWDDMFFGLNSAINWTISNALSLDRASTLTTNSQLRLQQSYIREASLELSFKNNPSSRRENAILNLFLIALDLNARVEKHKTTERYSLRNSGDENIQRLADGQEAKS